MERQGAQTLRAEAEAEFSFIFRWTFFAQMYVYFIRAGDYVKIGKAADPDDRMRGMQTACPFHMRLVAVIDCRSDAGAYHYERKLHHRFRKLRVRGEWYRWDRGLRQYVTENLAADEREMLHEEQLHVLMDAQARYAAERERDPVGA